MRFIVMVVDGEILAVDLRFRAAGIGCGVSEERRSGPHALCKRKELVANEEESRRRRLWILAVDAERMRKDGIIVSRMI